MTSKIVVVGSKGQVARSLAERVPDRAGWDLVLLGRPEIDLEKPGSAGDAIASADPDIVINAAAYTAVDQAEQEPERAFRINAEAAGEIADAARQLGAPIIHLSTDYVFDGTATRPINEDAPTRPLGVYGASKLAGEERVRAANPNHIIIRTSWVYSPFGQNFVKTMLRLADERDEVRVVDDQFGCPTSALDLADALLGIAGMLGGGRPNVLGETYHLVGGSACSWAQFAAAIFKHSAALGGLAASVIPIPTRDYPTPARRPAYSVLDCSRAERDLGLRLPAYDEGLAGVVARVLA